MRESIKRNRDLLLRLLAALAVGLAIAGTAYLCAYYQLRWIFDYQGSYARSKLRSLDHDIQDRKSSSGKLPASLTELTEVSAQRDDSGKMLDVYGNPYQYRLEGDSYSLFSFGRDGQPGGEGLDADIYPNGPNQAPTLHQFTFELTTEGPQLACILAGVCAGLVCLLQTRKRGWRLFFMRLGATAVGAVLAAIVISILHIPSGH